MVFPSLAPALVLGFAGLLGLVIGSFLNVVILRLPEGASIARPASHCPRCKHALAPWENIPLVSFLLLRGQCRGCGMRISARYPLIEALTGLVFALVVHVHGLSPMTPLWLAFAAALIAAAAIDFDHHMIPDEISLGGLVLALASVPIAEALMGTPYLEALARSALGALLGGGVLWAVGFAHARIATALGRTFEHWPGEGEALPRPDSLDYWVWFPGLGFGDVKLLAMIGAVLGPLGVLETIFASAVAGLLLGLLWGLATRSFASPFGFAPAIALGAVAVLASPVHLLPGF